MFVVNKCSSEEGETIDSLAIIVVHNPTLLLLRLLWWACSDETGYYSPCDHPTGEDDRYCEEENTVTAPPGFRIAVLGVFNGG